MVLNSTVRNRFTTIGSKGSLRLYDRLKWLRLIMHISYCSRNLTWWRDGTNDITTAGMCQFFCCLTVFPFKFRPRTLIHHWILRRKNLSDQSLWFCSVVLFFFFFFFFLQCYWECQCNPAFRLQRCMLACGWNQLERKLAVIHTKTLMRSNNYLKSEMLVAAPSIFNFGTCSRTTFLKRRNFWSGTLWFIQSTDPQKWSTAYCNLCSIK